MDELIEFWMNDPHFADCDKEKLRASLYSTFHQGQCTDYADLINRYVLGITTENVVFGASGPVVAASDASVDGNAVESEVVHAESVEESEKPPLVVAGNDTTESQPDGGQMEETSTPSETKEKKKRKQRREENSALVASTAVAAAAVPAVAEAPASVDPLLYARLTKQAQPAFAPDSEVETQSLGLETVEVTGHGVSIGAGIALGSVGLLLVAIIIGLASGGIQSMARAALGTTVGKTPLLREFLRALATCPSLKHRRSKRFYVPCSVAGQEVMTGDELFDLVMEHYNDLYGPNGDKLDIDDFDVYDRAAEFKINDVSLFIERVEDTMSGLDFVCTRVSADSDPAAQSGFVISYINPEIHKPWAT